LYASRNPIEGVEEIFFNEKNGLSVQMVAIMATVREGDSEFREKARRIAAFIDRWYVLGTLQESPVRQGDLLMLIRRLLPALRSCVTPDDVSRALADHIARQGEEPVRLEGFGLRGTNRQQIKYLLARITAYAMKGCGLRGDVDEYLSETKPYQIEHLFADKPERHRKEVPDPLQFRTLRSQFGGLALLPSSDNAAFGAMPLQDKIIRYGRQNVLLGVLNSDYHSTFGKLRRFAKENEIERYMRPFPPNASMSEVTQVRQELYLRISSRIWQVETICIDSATIPGYQDPFSPALDESSTRAHVKVNQTSDFARMVNSGALQAGTRMVIHYKDSDYWAEVRPDASVQLEATGVVYGNINDAGAIIRATKTCDGMKYWHVLRNGDEIIPLKQLRDQARADGIIPRR